MSGDVQPRKRKDKRRKKEGGSLGMIHEPVSSQKFKRSESEDQKIFDLPDQGEKIHIQSDHGVGGNICIKIIFFCLLGLLVGAIGLIYLKSQGSSDVDLPTIEESRFADYFTGWLDDNTGDEHGHEHEPEHDVYDGHDEHDNHEDIEGYEEDEDHSAEQDAIYKLFGVEDDAADEALESNMNDKVLEREDSGIEQDVNEDEEDGDDESDKLKEEEDVDDLSEELKEKEDEENEDDESDEVKEDENDEKNGDEESDEMKEKENDEDVDEEDISVELEQQDEEDDDQISKEEEDREDRDMSSEKKDLSEMNEEDEEDEETKEKKIKGAEKSIEKENSGNLEDQGSDEEKSKEDVVEVEEKEDEEQEERIEDQKTDDDFGYEEIDLSEEDLDDEPVAEPGGAIKEESEEEREKLFYEENKELLSEKFESEITKEEEETEFDTGGVAIKLGVGIALIIVAHLVLVQKWKSVSNAASDEKATFDAQTSEGKKDIENLHSADEPVISRRQTLVPESVFFNDGVDEDDMEDEDEEDVEEDYEEEEEDMEQKDEEECREPEFEKLEKKDWETFNESSWKMKSQENESDHNANFTKNEELEEEEEDDHGIDEEEEEERDNEVEEDEEQDDEVEEEEEELDDDIDEEEEEMEEDDYDDDENNDEVDGINDFRKQKMVAQDVEEMSSQEELKESTPIPPPRAHRDGRGAQDVSEDSLKQFAESGEVEETTQEYRYGEEAPSNANSKSENEKTVEKKVQEDEWSFRQELDFADEQFENNPKAAVEAYDKVISKKPTLIRALIGRARALDHWAEKEKSNAYLKKAIEAYKTLLLQQGNLLDNETYVTLAERCIERMRFSGSLLSAVEVHKALILKYPDTPKYRNMLAVTYLIMNKIPHARLLLNETLSIWPGNGFALAHYGFILKTADGNMEEGVEKMMAGIKTKEEGVISGMFFFHLGDALHRLGRNKEAMEWYELGVKEGLFFSKYQRSLYNVNRLRGRPWWSKEETTYQDFFKKLENNWREIRREGLELFNSKGINLFKEDAENLKDTGDWRQLDLYFRGRKTPSCNKAPVTCSLVSSFQPAATCTRGQIKFSVMLPNTHVWPHCGPTNCRLRSHLGLVVPKHTFIRVAEETRSWEEGKFIIFDDSFEHEVWHNGTGPRLVLIVDVWHPELTDLERRQLTPI